MVVGNGMIANRFIEYKDDDRIILFASGVSDSKCTDSSQFKREKDLVSSTIAANPDKLMVYISTMSIHDPSENGSDYVQHKKNIEEYIKNNAGGYLIVRASNVVGSAGNKKTVLNFFVNSIKEGTHFNLWANATRNILDVDDFYKIVTTLVGHGMKNKTINVANPTSYNVKHIVTEIENYLGVKANYTPVDKGIDFSVNLDDILPILDEKGVSFGPDYLPNLLKKYY